MAPCTPLPPPASAIIRDWDWTTCLARPWTLEEDIILETTMMDGKDICAPDKSTSKDDEWTAMIEELFVDLTQEEMERFHVLVGNQATMTVSGSVEFPSYTDNPPINSDSTFLNLSTSFLPIACDSRRKRRNIWSLEEHRKFLRGLEIYGKGDWRAISRHVVITRTPSQVASHAQKFFLRQQFRGERRRKRSSIHDITSAAT